MPTLPKNANKDAVEAHQQLLNEVITVTGYFAVENNDNQVNVHKMSLKTLQFKIFSFPTSFPIFFFFVAA